MKLVKGETLSEAIQRHHAQHRAGQTNPLSLPRLLNAFVSLYEPERASVRFVVSSVTEPDASAFRLIKVTRPQAAEHRLGRVWRSDRARWGLAKVIGEPDDAAAPIARCPSGSHARRSHPRNQISAFGE